MQSAGVVAAATVLPSRASAEIEPQFPRKKRALRIAHMTDIHVQPERSAALGWERCLEHAQGQRDKPDIIFTGGDLIMDALVADEARVKAQWDIFNRVLKRNIEVPVEHCLGNHDVWGWGARSTFRSASRFGKVFALDALELEKPYRSFDRAGWHFIVLDSTAPLSGNGYTAKLDSVQFEWLQDDLAKVGTKTPVFVLSHIPILSACAFYHGDNEKSGQWRVPGAWMHLDSRRIKDLFNRYPNVKVCVSGHIHLVDRVNYCGVTYTCRGAVSAGWWGGDFQETKCGYSLIDLYNDGTFFTRYVTYGWKPCESV
ncbi:MAG: metallophosphoesterase [Chlorobia bacterium]|nr:metallophosphoesterase [Fimbriimonadaceae bacterium]